MSATTDDDDESPYALFCRATKNDESPCAYVVPPGTDGSVSPPLYHVEPSAPMDPDDGDELLVEGRDAAAVSVVQCVQCKNHIVSNRTPYVRWPCGHYMHYTCATGEDNDRLCQHPRCRKTCIADLIDDPSAAGEDTERALHCLYRILTNAAILRPVSVSVAARLMSAQPERAQELAEIAAARAKLASGDMGPRQTPVLDALRRAHITTAVIERSCVSAIELRDACGFESWADLLRMGLSRHQWKRVSQQMWRTRDMVALFGPVPPELIT